APTARRGPRQSPATTSLLLLLLGLAVVPALVIVRAALVRGTPHDGQARLGELGPEQHRRQLALLFQEGLVLLRVLVPPLHQVERPEAAALARQPLRIPPEDPP